MSVLKKISNRLKLTSQVFFTGSVETRALRPIPKITLEEVAEIKTFFPMDKYFITGHPRSGTTLVTRLVQLHPQVHCNYQGHFFTLTPTVSEILNQQRFGKWMGSPTNRWNRGSDLTPVALRAMVDYIMERDARLAGKTVVGDKSPNMKTGGQAINEMYLIYPDAYVINMVRDGRDVLISHRFQAFIDKPELLTREEIKIRDAVAKDSEPFLRGERSLFTEARLREKASAWVRNVRETDQAGKRLYGDHFQVLRFEDILANPYQAVSRLWALLGEDPSGLADRVGQEMNLNPDADWQQAAAGKLVTNFKKGKSGSWKELFTERDKMIFKEVAGDFLIEWGYEKDLEW